MTAPLPADIECRRLDPQWRTGIGELCRALEAAGDTATFRPHGFDDGALDRLVNYTGQDLYYVMVAGPSVVGYGLLRGWDEGYAIPSLGIAIHPSCRRSGLGVALMHFLHAAARWRGATKVRLRVREDNVAAKSLYRQLGYSFVATEGEYAVGIIELTSG